MLVLNDEAHHAYRIKLKDNEAKNEDNEPEEENHLKEEATVWISGLDKINKLRNINFCVDLSATPYYLSRTGNDPGRPFPWVISDYGLIEAIESGLVKIPQLPIQDTTGKPIPAYFNVWKWIITEKLTTGEKGGKRGQINRKAVLKYAQSPINQLAGLWRDTFLEWQKNPENHPTPPVFIIVCRDTILAKYMYEWIGEGKGETAPPVEEFRNRDSQEMTIRIDSKVVEELETGIKSDEVQRLRFVLQTIGKREWVGKKISEDWQSLCDKLNRKAIEEGGSLIDSSIPPGRDVRCIISVAMLTEGWDATTVTHIVGLRPFMSQLLCEQVVGRGLRRTNYVIGPDGLFVEEEAKVYGVPFEVIPFKTNPQVAPPPPPKIWHVHALPEREHLKVEFPRVEAYSFAIKNKVTVDWDSVPDLQLDPLKIPPEITVKGLSWKNEKMPTLTGPGKVEWIDLEPWRREKRIQELEYELAKTLTRAFAQTPKCEVPVHALFRQMLGIVKKYVSDKVKPAEGYKKQDVFINPYYGWAVESLRDNIRPDTGAGEEAEIPIYDPRGAGSTADVDFWTSKEVKEVSKSHVNRAVLDTKIWEQSAAFYLDQNAAVESFVKNAGLGFEIPYILNNEQHGYNPDFIVRLWKDGKTIGHLILEVKGEKDEKVEVKASAAKRWIKAVNNDGTYGKWDYQIVYSPMNVRKIIEESMKNFL